MSGLQKYFRLLPAVVVVGMGVLALKGVEIARAAQALSVGSNAPDNAGLAPADTGTVHSTPDFATDDSAADSVAQVNILSSLMHRRQELDAREHALDIRDSVLNASEGRVDQKIAALKTLQTQIHGLLVQRDAAQDKLIASLVKTYSAMRPKDAARIFNSLDDAVLLPVARDMKSDVLAPVIAAMNSEAAQKLTVKLANLLKLPDLPAANCPAAVAEAAMPALTPTPGTMADSTLPTMAAPLQTATLTPSPAIASPVQTSKTQPVTMPTAMPLPAKQAAVVAAPAASTAGKTTPAAAVPPPKATGR